MKSTIKIDSIYIDLNEASQRTGQKESCGCFSIRAFVSEVRKKDWKLCWPFSSDNISEHQAVLLTPLCVPKFGSQRCTDCCYCDGKEAHNCISHRSAGSGNHSQQRSTKETTVSPCQKTCITEGREEASGHGIPNVSSPSKSGKDVFDSGKDSNGDLKNFLKDTSDGVISEAATCKDDVHSHSLLREESHNHNPGDILGNSHCKELNEGAEGKGGSHEIVHSELPLKEFSCVSEIPIQNISTIKVPTINHQNHDERQGCAAPKIAVVVQEPLVTGVQTNTSKSAFVCFKKDERTPAWKKQDGNPIGNYKRHGSSKAPQSRKIRKTRLLTELLGPNDYASSNFVMLDSPETKITVKDAITQGKKVKASPVDEGNYHELTYQNNGWKRVKTHNSKEHHYQSSPRFRPDVYGSAGEASEIDLYNCSTRGRITSHPMENCKEMDKILPSHGGYQDIYSKTLGPTRTDSNVLIAQPVDDKSLRSGQKNQVKNSFHCIDCHRDDVCNDVKNITKGGRLFPGSSTECRVTTSNSLGAKGCSSTAKDELKFFQEQPSFSRAHKITKVFPCTYVSNSNKHILGNLRTEGTVNEEPFSMDKHNILLDGKTEASSRVKKKSISGILDNEKQARGLSHPADKAVENLDDIAMDIVELLACHRYERSLQDRKDDLENNITTGSKDGTLRLFPENGSDLKASSNGPRLVNLIPDGTELSMGHSAMRQQNETYCSNQQQWNRILSSPSTVFKNGKNAPQLGVYASEQRSLNGNQSVGQFNKNSLGREERNKVHGEHHDLQKRPFRPLDLCLNETVPALHLLSLMDAGILSQNKKGEKMVNLPSEISSRHLHDHQGHPFSWFENHDPLSPVRKRQYKHLKSFPSINHATVLNETQPQMISGKQEIKCTVNRNPADFSFPEAGNMFMVEGEDLRFGGLSLCDMDRQKYNSRSQKQFV